MTAGSRHLAVLADAELRRRYPEAPLRPLASAEPEPLPDQLPAITDTEADARHAVDIAARQQGFRDKLERRLGLKIPAQDPDNEHEGDAWPAPEPADRDALLQPPKPAIGPPAMILRRQREAEPEHDR